MPVRPHEHFPAPGGRTADLYLVRFGPDGQLQSPKAAAAFLEATREATDVFVFSHGWNPTFQVALDRYPSFITGYIAQRQAFSVAPPEPYQPVMLGIIWPSTSFLAPWERNPAGGSPLATDPAARELEEMLDLVTSSLGRESGIALRELLEGRDRLDPADAWSAAELAHPLLAGEDPDTGDEAPGVSDLLAIWQRIDAGPSTAADADSQAQADGLDPRNLLRVSTLWAIKARADRVGAVGLAPLLDEISAKESAPRLHLIGHSFGARALLSALVGGETSPTAARSLLLLQAPVNRWCFADRTPTTNRPGGYREVLSRVELPVVSTFSEHDDGLRHYFHIALRAGQVGQSGVRGTGDPDLHGALGGYGPAGLGDEAVVVPAAAPGTVDAYPLHGPARVVAVDCGVNLGTGPAISGHGDISNAATWWALHSLTSA